MGIIIAKFRKKKTTYEILDELDNNIKSIENFGRDTEQTRKKIVKRFILVSVLVYSFVAVVLYYNFFAASTYERTLYVIPLILIPFILIFIKRILTWHYSRKIKKNQNKLSILKDEKKKILEEVMEKETYKVATTILEKFAPDQVKKGMSINQSTPTKPINTIVPRSINAPQTGLRYRGIGGPSPGYQAHTSFASPGPRSFVPAQTPISMQTPARNQMVSLAARPPNPGSPLRMTRTILPRERSVLDKMVDYLVGDGPSNRFALICSNCASHNGMALKEEFDYLSFRCCYCATFNPSRKKRPAAPKLEASFAIKAKPASDVSDSDQHSGSDSDSEGPIITEPDDVAKVSESEVKSSDTESLAMDVDNSIVENVEQSIVENVDNKSERKDELEAPKD